MGEPAWNWSVPGILTVELKAWGWGGVPSPAGLGSRAQCLTQTKYRVSISSPRHALPAGSKPTLFQVQEQLGHAGRCVLLPALGLGRGAALRQSVAVGRVARGPPQRLQGFRLAFAPFGGGWFAWVWLTLCGLWCGWIQQRWAWRELLLVPTEGRGMCHTCPAHRISAKPGGVPQCPSSDRKHSLRSTPGGLETFTSRRAKTNTFLKGS